MPPWLYSDLGLIDYESAHRLQLDLVCARQRGTLRHNVLLLLEHPPVITTGRRTGWRHLVAAPETLREKGIACHVIERGGDITYHGPGQLVAYPIMHLPSAGMGVVDFVTTMEACMIRTARQWAVFAARDDRNRGVWVKDRKLGSIGICVRRGVTFHGLALNVNLNLASFSWIVPCGLDHVAMTALDRETDQTVTMDGVKSALRRHWAAVFHTKLSPVTPKTLSRMTADHGPMGTGASPAPSPRGRAWKKTQETMP